MQRQRFALALERLASTDWKRFEEFASAFLVHDFPSLRTVASLSGDKGRDAELFSPDGQPTVVLQFSVTENWKSKISDTAGRLEDVHTDARLLIYVTNQQIGASADDIRQDFVKSKGLVLDIYDRNWFLDRFEANERREILAEKLAVDIVDPYLATKA